MKNKEIWQDILGYEDKYQVSDFGRIKALNYKGTGKEQVLKLNSNGSGYLIINLYQNGKRESFLVHRLVAGAFMRFSSMEINHIDGNKLNNALDNLEYCTRSHNLKHSFRELGRNPTRPMSGRSGESHPKSIKIDMLSENFAYIRTWNGVREAARALNIAPNGISKVLKGKQRTAGGFTFKYN